MEPHLYCSYIKAYIHLQYVGVRRKGKDLWGSEHSTLVIEEGNTDLICAPHLNSANTVKYKQIGHLGVQL